jgi:uncharacterized protein DUF6933
VPIIMCTRGLWRAIGGQGILPQRRPTDAHTSRLAVWSARDVPTAAGRIVVALEESTYLTIVCPLLPLPGFVLVFAASVGTALEDVGIPAGLVQSEVAAIVEGASFARNDNRSLLGSVNDVAFHADVLLEDARRNDLSALGRAQRELNEMPHVRRQPPFPSQAVRLLFLSAFAVH